jgi:hypothetical protein
MVCRLGRNAWRRRSDESGAVCLFVCTARAPLPRPPQPFMPEYARSFRRRATAHATSSTARPPVLSWRSRAVIRASRKMTFRLLAPLVRHARRGPAVLKRFTGAGHEFPGVARGAQRQLQDPIRPAAAHLAVRSNLPELVDTTAASADDESLMPRFGSALPFGSCGANRS